MPETKVTIVITGRIYCRVQDGLLEGLPLHADAKHKLHLRITSKKDALELKGDYLIPKQTKMWFTTSDTTSEPAPSNAQPFADWVTNIDTLHERNVHLRRLISEPQPTTVSYLRLPEDSSFYSYNVTKAEYNIWKHNLGSGSKFLRSISRIGDKIGADYLIQEGGEMKLHLQSHEGEDLEPYPFRYEKDLTYTIEFDNACEAHDCGDDFYLYYKLLDGKGIQFEQELRPGKDVQASCNPIYGDPGCKDLEYYFAHGSCS